MAENLMEGLIKELNRNRELVEIYKKIPTGHFGAAFIKNDIEKGEKAIADGDTIAMLRAYETLKNNK